MLLILVSFLIYPSLSLTGYQYTERALGLKREHYFTVYENCCVAELSDR